eukprot:CAMPEP_0181047378 /NCGR_PEP_ID=MMETSP1070-20121207/14848_1 /TAXON_ID=265543 /ORGANISM="Minutocellus polymorphus, Strain NH13" /LENGTH=1781 /DNA_ID=CAMNT_0023126047 /DNA_START=297 /DNA_END=5642 /DNA_ORIENTATION=+
MNPAQGGPPSQGAPLQQPPQQGQYQQRPPQGGQGHLPVQQGLNGGWQSDKDVNERRKMIAKIVQLLQQRKPNAPQEWLNKLPQMAKRLEESLYRSAPSFEAYKDVTTLKQRLQQLAMNIGMKTKNAHAVKARQQQAAAQGQGAPPPGQGMSRPPPQYQQQQPPSAMRSQPPMPGSSGAGQPMPPAMPLQQQQPSPAPSGSGGRHMVNMNDINPMASSGRQGSVPPQPGMPQVAPSAPQVAGQQHMPPSHPGVPPGSSGRSAGSGSSGSRKISDRQQVLRHQQQRLLLLRHAAKCPHEDGRCPVTPHCAGMKRLWKHIAECKDQKCLVPHCVSSRYVLSHYHRCKDVRCPVCGPVREAIHRSHEKQKQMQSLKVGRQEPQGGEPMGQVFPPNQQASSSKRRRTSAGAVPGAVGSQQGYRQQHHQPLPRPPGAPGQPGYQYNRGLAPGVRPAPGVAGVAYANGQVIMPKHTGPKPQEDHTLINCFTVEQIETHIESLNNGLQLSPQKLKLKAADLLRILMAHQHGWVFNTPVDPVELGLPDYFQVIKKPMDLGTVKKRVENGCYTSIEGFQADVLLTFDNAMMYNPDGSVVHNMAKEMRIKFVSDYDKLISQLQQEEEAKRLSGDACALCGCEKLLFEPPVFYCNGLKCPSKRIRRNSYYFVGGNNQYHWCHLCYAELKETNPIELADMTIRKSTLLKKKNDEVHEESWVQCDKCERWIHQICALFNTRQNKDQRSEYTCPKCTIDERKVKGSTDATSTTPMAEDLPRTKLSEYLEMNVRKRVDAWLERAAKEKVETEHISMEKAKKDVALGGHITIRQVTSMDRRLDVRERMKKRYAFKNYPDEFNFRCKCIVVFQNLDGVDTMLFGLYVYEHDEKNPAPNTRTVYVSYLDSVYYMRPRRMRTYIYHEILIAYLDYVRHKGFSTAHIWACPPLKGDDYILYAKPEDQKTPRDDRLRQWYVDMLVECQMRGICDRVTNMYDLYFADSKNDAAIVPYMEGDYFPAEVENIIKELEEGKGVKKAKESGKKKKAKKAKKPGNRGGTRSTGYDEEAFKASGFQPEGQNQASLEEGGRDFVMAKLGETIHPMKESFLVAFLNWKGIAEENKAVPKVIAEFREKHGISVGPGEPAAEASIEYLAREAAKAAGRPVDGEGANDNFATAEAKPSAAGDDLIKKSQGDATASADDKPGGDTADKSVNGDAKPSAEEQPTDAAVDDKAAGTQEDSAVADADKEESKEGESTSPQKPSETADKPSESPDDKKSEEKKDNGDSGAEGNDEAKGEGDNKADDDAKPNDEPKADGEAAEEGNKPDAADADADKPDAEFKSDTDAAPADVKMEDASESKEDEKKETDPEAEVDAVADATTKKGASEEAVDGADRKAEDGADKKAEDGAEPMDTDEKKVSVEAEPTSDEKKEGASTDNAKDDDKAAAKEEGEAAKSTEGDAMDVDKPNDANAKDANAKEKDSPPDAAKSGDHNTKDSADASPNRGGKFAAMAAKKRDVDGNIKTNPDAEEKKDGDDKGKAKEGDDNASKNEKKKEEEDTALSVKDSKGRTVKVLDDDDEELDCEFLNNRQAFLNLCQGNHYQFDQLRRAKHSSMMVLWHLHNRDAPKFVQQCAICSREILQGFRYHCPTCADFDQCEECLRNPATPRHPHQLKPIAVATGQQQQMSEEQRKERQRSIQLHMTLLLHAATCQAPKCPSANCTKMKGLLKHGASCQIKAQGGCHVCKRIWALLQIHARQCKAQQCPVPNCMAIRERFRQLRQQQMAMDDRRRQEMNRAYRR